MIPNLYPRIIHSSEEYDLTRQTKGALHKFTRRYRFEYFNQIGHQQNQLRMSHVLIIHLIITPTTSYVHYFH